MGQWRLHDAKNRLSRAIEEARMSAQIVTVRGRAAAVVISIDEYRRLTEPQLGLLTFLRESPLFAVTLDLERDADAGRETRL